MEGVDIGRFEKDMKYRTLGRTGFKVSEIGYGAWGIGGGLWTGSRDDESVKALQAAIDNGVTFIDTALAYSDGHSEKLIASVLSRRSETVFVATKIPPKNLKWPAADGTPLKEAFPKEYIRHCAERSLKNLDVDSIDLLQFHVWSDQWHDMDEWRRETEELTRSGKVQHWGISINDHQPTNVLKTLETGAIDAVQVIYNIFDQAPENELFPYCLKNNIGVIVRVPLDEGGLTGSITPDTVFAERDFRAGYFRGDRKRQVQERVNKLAHLMGSEAKDVPELALRFTLEQEAVSTVIPGMRSSKNVLRNVAVSDGRRLSADLRSTIKSHAWRRNFYQG